jgi:endonuclease/exonuclease/phosphatase (EEP) superfamily protein YafD
MTDLLLSDTLLLTLSLIFIAGTLLPFIRTDTAWIRMLDFPRSQIAVGGFCTVVLSLRMWELNTLTRALLLGLLGLCVLYQALKMYPYTRLASQQVQSSRKPPSPSSFSLLISNVLQENRNIEKYLQIVRAADPDIVLAVETDRWWTQQLGVLDERYPYAVKYPLENWYGMLLYSRLRLIKPTVQFLVEKDIPSIHTEVELRSKDVITLHCLHPRPPRPDHGQDTTERDAELLIVGRAAKEAGKPTLVAGDLNDVAWSATTTLFQKISRLLDPRIGRGMYNTFDARIPLLRWPLDHIFHSDHFRLIRLQRLPYFGSDHFPMYMELSYEPEAVIRQEAPPADAEDHIEAAEKIDRVEQKEPVRPTQS